MIQSNQSSSCISKSKATLVAVASDSARALLKFDRYVTILNISGALNFSLVDISPALYSIAVSDYYLLR